MKSAVLLRAVTLLSLELSQCFYSSPTHLSSTLSSPSKRQQSDLPLRLRMHSVADCSSMQRRSFLASAASAGILLFSSPLPSAAQAQQGTVTIVGADSYVGGDVLRLLIKKGVPVQACISPTSSLNIEGDPKLVSVRRCDVNNEMQLQESVTNSRAVIYAVEPSSRPAQQPVSLKESADRAEESSMEATGLNNVAKSCLAQDVQAEEPVDPF
eukprot:747810-Hanusia_phi.AAC.3